MSVTARKKRTEQDRRPCELTDCKEVTLGGNIRIRLCTDGTGSWAGKASLTAARSGSIGTVRKKRRPMTSGKRVSVRLPVLAGCHAFVSFEEAYEMLRILEA